MMIKILEIMIFAWLSLIITCVSANDEDNNTLSQEQVTAENYRKMAEYSIKYRACLSEISFGQIENYDDPRRLVDFAMKECAVTLEKLDDWLQERNFPEILRRGHLRKISNKAVRNILPHLMFMMSTRQAGE